jgi:hypothetical protein
LPWTAREGAIPAEDVPTLVTDIHNFRRHTDFYLLASHLKQEHPEIVLPPEDQKRMEEYSTFWFPKSIMRMPC